MTRTQRASYYREMARQRWCQAFANLEMSQNIYNDNWAAYLEWAEDEAASARWWTKQAKRMKL